MIVIMVHVAVNLALTCQLVHISVFLIECLNTHFVCVCARAFVVSSFVCSSRIRVVEWDGETISKAGAI
jgi:hypothetical protein